MKLTNKYIFNLIVANILWSFIPIVATGLFDDISIITIIVLRFLTSGIVLFVIAILIALVNNHFNKGRKYIDQNKLKEALTEFNLALERNNTNQTVINAINTTERRITEEAARLIQQSEEELARNNYADAQLLLSEAQILSEGNQEVLDEISALINEVDIQKFSQRGMLYFQLNEFDKAVVMFEKVLAMEPENESAREYFDRCKIELSTSTQMMDPQTEERYLIGINEYINGNYDNAIAIWDSILVEQPYNKKVLSAIRTAKNRLKQNTN